MPRLGDKDNNDVFSALIAVLPMSTKLDQSSSIRLGAKVPERRTAIGRKFPFKLLPLRFISIRTRSAAQRPVIHPRAARKRSRLTLLRRSNEVHHPCLNPFVSGRHDAAGQTLAHVYFDDEPRLGRVKERLTREEARCIAVNIVKLPKLLNRPQY